MEAGQSAGTHKGIVNIDHHVLKQGSDLYLSDHLLTHYLLYF